MVYQWSTTSILINCNDTTIFERVCDFLGVEVKTTKSITSCVVDFTGIEIDTNKMEAQLPQDKHNRALKALSETLEATKPSHKALESLLGFLSYCAKVVLLGRPFLRNLFNFKSSIALSKPLALHKLPEETSVGG